MKNRNLGVVRICFVLIALIGGIGFLSVSATTIALTYPTKKNLERYVYLIENDLITADDNIELLGIFHRNQKVLIDEAIAYVEANELSYISFEYLEGYAEDLFAENAYSQDFESILKNSDAIIFNGGADIPPFLYGEETFLTTGILTPERLWELSMLYHLIGREAENSIEPLLNRRPKYVVLGICLGMQEMNVAAGGSMYQDIPFQVYGISSYEVYHQLPSDIRHRNDRDKSSYQDDDVFGVHFHDFRVDPKGFLSFKQENTVQALSAHHQTLKRIGDHLKVVATSVDEKIIEAIQHETFENVYGVQFHPEVSQIYRETMLKVGNKEVIEITAETKQFHRDFWADFSKRLKNQHEKNFGE